VVRLACRPVRFRSSACLKVAKVRSPTRPVSRNRAFRQADRWKERELQEAIGSGGLLLAPGETAAAMAELSSDDVVRARLDGALVHFRRLIVERHMATILAVGHRHHDVAPSP